MLSSTFGGFSVVIVLFLAALAILWFCLPFAIFGTKPKLDELIEETRKTNEALQQLREQMDRGSGPSPNA